MTIPIPFVYTNHLYEVAIDHDCLKIVIAIQKKTSSQELKRKPVAGGFRDRRAPVDVSAAHHDDVHGHDLGVGVALVVVVLVAVELKQTIINFRGNLIRLRWVHFLSTRLTIRMCSRCR